MAQVKSVESNVRKGGFTVTYSIVNPDGAKGNAAVVRKFVYVVSSSAEKKIKMVNPQLLARVLNKIFEKRGLSQIWRMSVKEVRMELVRNVNRLNKSRKQPSLLNELKTQQQQHQQQQEEGDVSMGEGEDGEDDDAKIARLAAGDPKLPPASMFAVEEESANTKVFLAPSFSGKTTLMVDELNKLSKKELDGYDKIVLFTRSPSAKPLKNLSKDVLKKLVVYDKFIPQYVKALKKINTVTENRYRFLLLLDDCLNLKGSVMETMILTLRNVNISTVVSVQYSKLLSKSQRQSIHDYYLLNMKCEDLEYLMSGFLAPHFRELFVKEGLRSKEDANKMRYKQLAELAMKRLKGKALHFSQREDQIFIYDRGLGDKKGRGGKEKKKKKKRGEDGEEGKEKEQQQQQQTETSKAESKKDNHPRVVSRIERT